MLLQTCYDVVTSTLGSYITEHANIFLLRPKGKKRIWEGYAQKPFTLNYLVRNPSKY